MKKYCLIITVAFLMMFGIGCNDKTANTVEKTGFTALSAMAIVYDSGMELAGTLYKAGKISDADKEKLIVIAEAYRYTGETVTKLFREYNAEPNITILIKAASEFNAFKAKYQEFLAALKAVGVDVSKIKKVDTEAIDKEIETEKIALGVENK